MSSHSLAMEVLSAEALAILSCQTPPLSKLSSEKVSKSKRMQKYQALLVAYFFAKHRKVLVELCFSCFRMIAHHLTPMIFDALVLCFLETLGQSRIFSQSRWDYGKSIKTRSKKNIVWCIKAASNPIGSFSPVQVYIIPARGFIQASFPHGSVARGMFLWFVCVALHDFLASTRSLNPIPLMFE